MTIPWVKRADKHALHGLNKPDEQARWNRLCQALDLAEPIRKSPEEML